MKTETGQSAVLPAEGGAANIFPNAPILGKLGTLEVRLARSESEIIAAQSLRFEVFFEEGDAVPDSRSAMGRLDHDNYDAICDHLIVLDTEKDGHPIVATYRLLRQEIAQTHGGFYSASEFFIEPMLQAHSDLRFLELGRSCVHVNYRNKRTMELLWQGTWAYILDHKMDVLFGCASLAGTDPDSLALPLSFLSQNCCAIGDWSVEPLQGIAANFNVIAKDEIDLKAAMRSLPPLVKGYLRLGAKISAGAVVDAQFGTTDVMIILPVADLNPAYVAHYGADASRYAG